MPPLKTLAEARGTTHKPRELTRAKIYNNLGILNSREDQVHTRELLNELIMDLDVKNFNNVQDRENVQAALVEDLTSGNGELCESIRTAYVQNSDECLTALYQLARLVKKSWLNYAKNHPTPPPADSGSDTESDTASESRPTLQPAQRQAIVDAFVQPPPATPAATVPSTTVANPPPSGSTTVAAGAAAAASVSVSVPVSAPACADPRARNWIPDLQFYLRDSNIDTALPQAEFTLSNLLSNPAGHTVTVLYTTWVDAAGLRFVRFVDTLSQRLGGITLSDLTGRTLWLRAVHPTNHETFQLLVRSEDGELGGLEEAFGTVMKRAMTYSWFGVLLPEGAPGSYEAMRAFFLEK